MTFRIAAFAASLALIVAPAIAAPALEQLGEFPIKEANQGVGVDANYFYAVDNTTIGKYDKKTGKLVKKWEEKKDGPIEHLDSALLMDGKIYCAHSNYPKWPMTSSLEIFDAETLEHIGSHSFGIQWGSLTWVDWNGADAGLLDFTRRLIHFVRSSPGLRSTSSEASYTSPWEVMSFFAKASSMRCRSWAAALPVPSLAEWSTSTSAAPGLSAAAIWSRNLPASIFVQPLFSSTQ